MNVIAIVPARGGSKGVPGKNIRPLAGKPLIVWTLEAALACPAIGRVIVSTDHPDIAAIARSAGGDVPFLRPSALAEDDTPDLPVCLHALEWLRTNSATMPDIVVWLRPTTPLREPQDISDALALRSERDAVSVRSVCQVDHHPYWMKTLDGSAMRPLLADCDERRFPRRQLLPPVYRLNGAVDVTTAAQAMAGEALFAHDARAYVMPLERSVDIDTEADFAMAEYLMARRHACA